MGDIAGEIDALSAADGGLVCSAGFGSAGAQAPSDGWAAQAHIRSLQDCTVLERTVDGRCCGCASHGTTTSQCPPPSSPAVQQR